MYRERRIMTRIARPLAMILLVLIASNTAPAAIVVDGHGDESEWADAAHAVNPIVSDWGATNQLASLKALVMDDNLYFLLTGAMEPGNAIVVYVQAAGTGGIEPIQATDVNGQLDNALCSQISLTDGQFASVGWGTLDLERAVNPFDDRMGWRDLRASHDDLSWLDNVENPSACSGTACEAAISLAALGGTGPYRLFARLVDATGTYLSNQCLPEDNSTTPGVVSVWLEAGSGVVALDNRTWGEIKSMYR